MACHVRDAVFNTAQTEVLAELAHCGHGKPCPYNFCKRQIFKRPQNMLRKSLVILTLLTCSLFHQAHAATSSTRSSGDATWKRRQALFAYNAKAPLNARLVSRQDTTVSTIERYTIRGAKGDTVPLLFVMPKVATNARVPVLVVVHGFLGNIDQMLFVAQICANNGYASIIPEIVAHGARRKNNENLFGGDADFLYNGMVETVGDVRRSIDFLETRPRIDRNRIGYLGISLGSILGTMTMAVEPRLKAAGFVVGGADWKLIIPAFIEAERKRDRQNNRNGALLRRTQKLLDDIDPKNYAARITPRPMLMINGRNDTIIPPASARALYQSARQPKTLQWLEGGHVLPPIEVASTLLTWFDRNLKRRPATSRSATSRSATSRIATSSTR